MPEARNEILRVGIVGAGMIARIHVAAWREQGAAVTVWSRSGAADFARELGLAVSDSFERLLETSDIVDICSPTTSHPGYVRAAVDAGVPVVCEKPLALTVADAEALVDYVAARGVSVYPAHVVRWFPEYAAARSRILGGSLGSVAVARFVRSGEYPSWGRWFANDEASGGIIQDQMIHDLDIARWMLGEVITVHAVMRVAKTAAARSAHVLLTHESGAISSVTGVWGAPGVSFATRFSVSGTGGTLSYDSRDRGTFLLDGGSSERVSAALPSSSGSDPYALELADFALAVRGGPAPRVTLHDGLAAVRIARAAIESLSSDVPVEVAR